jgi:2-oxoglutarate ferredoxin oxidoreductase subunit gamma
MNYLETIISGFGGQGILSAGRILATCGLVEGKDVSWYPSYGPEMRGGTANCAVIISSKKIGSPIVNTPSAAIIMNINSMDKFESSIANEGFLFADSNLVTRKTNRDDIQSFYVPATEIATKLGNKTFANIVLLGKLIKETKIISSEVFEEALRICLPQKKHYMIPDEVKALKIGMNFQENVRLLEN